MFDNRAFESIGSQFKSKALPAFGLALTADAARNAPVKTGTLKNSISYKKEDEDTIRVGSSLKYANIQEFYSGYLAGALDTLSGQADSIIKGLA